MWIYAYILSMVKDRVRAGCWSHFFVRAITPSMDRDWRGSRPRSPRYHTAIGRARPDPEGGSEDLHPHPLTHEDYPHGRPPYYRASLSSPPHPWGLPYHPPSILILTGVPSPWRTILTHILISHGHPLSSPVRSILTGAPQPASSSSPMPVDYSHTE